MRILHNVSTILYFSQNTSLCAATSFAYAIVLHMTFKQTLSLSFADFLKIIFY